MTTPEVAVVVEDLRFTDRLSSVTGWLWWRRLDALFAGLAWVLYRKSERYAFCSLVLLLLAGYCCFPATSRQHVLVLYSFARLTCLCAVLTTVFVRPSGYLSAPNFVALSALVTAHVCTLIFPGRVPPTFIGVTLPIQAVLVTVALGLAIIYESWQLLWTGNVLVFLYQLLFRDPVNFFDFRRVLEDRTDVVQRSTQDRLAWIRKSRDERRARRRGASPGTEPETPFAFTLGEVEGTLCTWREGHPG